MSHNDLAKLREHAPVGAEAVRNIITLTEHAIGRYAGAGVLGQSSITFGTVRRLAVDIGSWDQDEDAHTGSAERRRVSIRNLDCTLDERKDPQIVYGITGRTAVLGKTSPWWGTTIMRRSRDLSAHLSG